LTNAESKKLLEETRIELLGRKCPKEEGGRRTFQIKETESERGWDTGRNESVGLLEIKI
jgi:chloramphenicol 3-O-phosphotransferase